MIKSPGARMAQNYLKLNVDKIEFMVIGSPSNLKKVVTELIVVGRHKILNSEQVINIGANFDSSTTMEALQVAKIAPTALCYIPTGPYQLPAQRCLGNENPIKAPEGTKRQREEKEQD